MSAAVAQSSTGQSVATAAKLGYYLSDFVQRHGLGIVFAQDTGFKITRDPDTVRPPDVAFLGRDRADQIPARGYAEVAPDLLAEILSLRRRVRRGSRQGR